MAGSEYGVTLPRHGAPFLRRCIARHLICAEGARPDRSYGEGNIIDEPPVDKMDSIGNGSLRKSACVVPKMFHGGERAPARIAPVRATSRGTITEVRGSDCPPRRL